jgi:hypothetical protein
MTNGNVHVSLIDDASRNHGGDFRVVKVASRDGVMSLQLEYAGTSKDKRLTDAYITIRTGVLAEMLNAVLMDLNERDVAAWTGKDRPISN